ncbi:hypothetical protein LCGC14_2802990 [marine sediment metagenome]|uniref:Uncharacterized protein n=1 Tax=marine sediment metagenome TaxID=412755 RepID=A0A0F9BDJ1_9ZZZZ
MQVVQGPSYIAGVQRFFDKRANGQTGKVSGLVKQRNETTEKEPKVEPTKNQVKITLQDIRSGKYVLDVDVQVKKREGFSPNGWARGKTPKSQVDVTHLFGGASVNDLLDDGLERAGVRFRASARQANFYPVEVLAIDADYTKGSKLDVSSLTPETRAKMLVASIPEDQRDEVKAAILKALGG